eukprot:gnl/MRDRNA2_/MRDRNA2_86454_c0_seq2.p1 gnl/MRDRNA2_/MRDRNA2_86454_c0~~gnl/MRDRNA2_/MRDRNA2_86454_c0_seq2.p1  ORF type:complete len:623 (+),score=-17.26 gnl/MRDRNA2_/MRDRNA2_86454_c0_seq2:109-1977(+)
MGAHRVVVLIGEMGSGKSTQLPRILYEANFARNGVITCSEPRRVAVFSIAGRVAAEMGVDLGAEVGYGIRFQNITNYKTNIKYITDGLLLREIMFDPLLTRYCTIIVDEVHERTVQTDILLSLLKRTLAGRPDYLAIIAASATLETVRYTDYFAGAPCTCILGKQFSIKVVYTPEISNNFLISSYKTILKIHCEEPQGDILVFLPGQNEIEWLGDKVAECCRRKLTQLQMIFKSIKLCKLFAAMPPDCQVKALIPSSASLRKVVLATNIAETSLTIRGIRYVVDSGLVRTKIFSGRSGFDSMFTIRTSIFQASQRAGRAGRALPGKCYRLFPETFLLQMNYTTTPEIIRCKFPSLLLKLKFMGIDNILAFDFFETPSLYTILRALELLFILHALDKDAFLTSVVGFNMNYLALDPMLAKVVLSSAVLRCSKEALMIAAVMAVESPLFNQQPQGVQKRCLINSRYGDHLTILYVYQIYHRLGNKGKILFCDHYNLDIRVLEKASDIYKQLRELVERLAIPVVSCETNVNALRLAVTAGLFPNAAKRKTKDIFKVIASGLLVKLHHSSALSDLKNTPSGIELIVFSDHTFATTATVREATRINVQWLYKLAPKIFKFESSSLKI